MGKCNPEKKEQHDTEVATVSVTYNKQELQTPHSLIHRGIGHLLSPYLPVGHTNPPVFAQ